MLRLRTTTAKAAEMTNARCYLDAADALRLNVRPDSTLRYQLDVVISLQMPICRGVQQETTNLSYIESWDLIKRN